MDPFAPPPRRRRSNTFARTRPIDVDVVIDVDADADTRDHSSGAAVQNDTYTNPDSASPPLPSPDSLYVNQHPGQASFQEGFDHLSVHQPSSAFHSASFFCSQAAQICTEASLEEASNDVGTGHIISSNMADASNGITSASVCNSVNLSADDLVHQPTNTGTGKINCNNTIQPAVEDAPKQDLTLQKNPSSAPLDLTKNNITVAEQFLSPQNQDGRIAFTDNGSSSDGLVIKSDCAPTLREIRTFEQPNPGQTTNTSAPQATTSQRDSPEIYAQDNSALPASVATPSEPFSFDGLKNGTAESHLSKEPPSESLAEPNIKNNISRSLSTTDPEGKGHPAFSQIDFSAEHAEIIRYTGINSSLTKAKRETSVDVNVKLVKPPAGGGDISGTIEVESGSTAQVNNKVSLSKDGVASDFDSGMGTFLEDNFAKETPTFHNAKDTDPPTTEDMNIDSTKASNHEIAGEAILSTYDVTERVDTLTCVEPNQTPAPQCATHCDTDPVTGLEVYMRGNQKDLFRARESHLNSTTNKLLPVQHYEVSRGIETAAVVDMTPTLNSHLPIESFTSRLNNGCQDTREDSEKFGLNVSSDKVPLTATRNPDATHPVEREMCRIKIPNENLNQKQFNSLKRPASEEIVRVDSPIDLDGSSSADEENPIPIYTISDDDDGEHSDVEIVKEFSADSVVSDNVKSAMTRLHFENVAVAIPSFTRCEPPSADDLAVLQAIADVFKEDAIRMKKAHIDCNRSRNVLVVVSTVHRADKMDRFFHTHSELNAVRHGIQNRMRNSRAAMRRGREDAPFSSVFSSSDVVVTTDKAVCRHCDRHSLNLRDVSLVVLDTAEFMWNRSHPASRFLRDYYRALPEFVRPRILAIVRRTMRPGETAPIEYNTFTRFVPSPSRGVVWKSCYGKGPRKMEHELLDVEYVHYRDNCDETIYIQGRKLAAPRATDRREFTPLDSVVDEVGPLGVALYRNKAMFKRRQRANGMGCFRDESNKKIQLSGDHDILGLSQKTLSLLNELYEAYRASTEVDALMAIIYAGKPAVACAVCEVINSMPVFTDLIVRVVVGNSRSESNSLSSFDGFEYRDWQGEDTDDDEVSSFTSREIDVLIVSENYVKGAENRPLPACPLVIRFDGSEANPMIDGGGGRCRVIVFKDHTRRGDPTAEMSGEHLTEVEEVRIDKGNQLPPPVIPTSHANIVDVHEKSHVPHADSVGTILDAIEARPSSQICSGPRQHTSKEERRNLEFTATETYYCRPPACLLGLDSGAGGRVYLYRILLYSEGTSTNASAAPKFMQSGLENFAVALSEKLFEQDTVLSLKDYHIGCGNGTSVEGSIRLIYQGLITLTKEKLDMVQRYTTRLFNLVDSTYTEEEFVWDSNLAKSANVNDPTHISFLRRYLVLPVITCNNKTEANPVSRTVEQADSPVPEMEGREVILKRYFGDPPNNVAPFSSIVKVDWKAIEMILSLCNRDKHVEELNPLELVDRAGLNTFEGQILFSSFPHESVVLAGKLQYDVSPLSTISRSRKFFLNDDGTLKPCSDLSYLTKVEATEESIRRQRCSTGSKQNLLDADGVEVSSSECKGDSGFVNASKNPRLIPVRWCEQDQALVPTGEPAYAEKEASRFDCERNILKKRKYWTCSVRYEIEYYFNRFYRECIRQLDQPLLLAALPRRANLSEFVDIIRGKHISDLAADIVQSKGEKRYLVPELCRVYPISSGMLFLPCALHFIEQHLSICELRSLFDPHVGVIGDTAYLVRAVTPCFRNNKTNYERLEFLGDSLFKLACTTRLMKLFVHADEGILTKERNKAVANTVLKKCGQRMRIYNYFRFHQETDSDWRPPGTDTRGPGRKFQMKAVADVVEALCGAYFEIGVVQALENRDSRKSSAKRAKLEVSHSYDEIDSGESSDSDTQWIQDSDLEVPIVIDDENGSDDDDDDDGDTGEKTKKRKISESGLGTSRKRFTVSSVCYGYGVGAKFLECIGALDSKEPTHEELLKTTIQSINPKRAKVTVEGEELFPSDLRLNNSNWDQKYSKVEGILNYEFKRRSLLICALTHGSYIKGGGKVPRTETYERLEFLGDAVADFFVACHLYERYPECSPGELTDLKGNVVSNESFARVTVTNGIHNFLDHNSGTLAMEISAFVQSLPQDLTVGGDGSHSVRKKDYGEFTAPKALGDVFEAIVGAVFVDAGLGEAWRVCSKLLRDSLRINADRGRHDLHPINELADKVRRVWGIIGDLKFRDEYIPQNKKKVAIYILGEKVATGIANIAKRARLLAARNALTFLSNEDINSEGAKMRARLMAKGLQELQRVRQCMA